MIGWGCALSAKYDQKATLLRQGYAANATTVNGPEGWDELEGSFVVGKHPVTGEPIRVWTPVTQPDNPDTDIDESEQVLRFACQARPIITGGLNSQGTTERWTTKGSYENVEYIEMQIPKNIIVTKRDRVTNITDSRGNEIWLEEEHGSFKSTVFDVRGVSPSLDPFGSVVEYFALLERAEIQGGIENG